MYCLLSFCCVCLTDREELQSLSNTDVDNVQLLDKLNFCAFETEWIQTNFPIFICYKCCHNLRVSYEFKKMCHKNNKLLRGYVSQLNATESLESLSTERFTILKDIKSTIMDPKLVQDTGAAQYCKTELDYSPSRSLHTLQQLTESDSALGIGDIQSKHVIKHFPKLREETIVDLMACSENVNNPKISDTSFIKDELGILNFGLRNPYLPQSNSQIDDRYHCSLCNRSFTQKSYLEKHLVTHTIKKPHNCALCNKTFSRKLHLERHMLTHSGKRSHHCALCSKSFILKSHLNGHMLTHTGIKSHHCSLCSKNFARKSDLHRHMLIHTVEKFYSCSFCTKSFARKSHLARHMIFHSGKRPHHCSLCSKSFILKSHLNDHMLTHTGVKSHHCTICVKSFGRKSDLNRHMLTHSADKTHNYTL